MLEKGNNNAGRLKRTIFWGGSDVHKEGEARPLQKYVHRSEEVGEDGEVVVVEKEGEREQAHGRAYQMMGLQLIAEELSSRKKMRALARRSADSASNFAPTRRVKPPDTPE